MELDGPAPTVSGGARRSTRGRCATPTPPRRRTRAEPSPAGCRRAADSRSSTSSPYGAARTAGLPEHARRTRRSVVHPRDESATGSSPSACRHDRRRQRRIGDCSDPRSAAPRSVRVTDVERCAVDRERMRAVTSYVPAAIAPSTTLAEYRHAPEPAWPGGAWRVVSVILLPALRLRDTDAGHSSSTSGSVLLDLRREIATVDEFAVRMREAQGNSGRRGGKRERDGRPPTSLERNCMPRF